LARVSLNHLECESSARIDREKGGRFLLKKKKRISVEQVVAVLKQEVFGVPVVEVIRKAGISEQTFHRWKTKYVGLEVNHVRQMKPLQEENLWLK
jgi:putative transposase